MQYFIGMALVFHCVQLIMSKAICFLCGQQSICEFTNLAPASQPWPLTTGVNGFQLQARSSPSSFLQDLELDQVSEVGVRGDEEILGMSISTILQPGWI